MISQFVFLKVKHFFYLFFLNIWPSQKSLLCSEASAKTKDGVQCAFEELVEKILQTPGLWESDNLGHRVQLGSPDQAGGRACGGYCSIPWNWTERKKKNRNAPTLFERAQTTAKGKECCSKHCSLHNYFIAHSLLNLFKLWMKSNHAGFASRLGLCHVMCEFISLHASVSIQKDMRRLDSA